MRSDRPRAPEAAQLKRDYAWNAAASVSGSLALVVMLAVVNRAAGIEALGLYSLAIGIGQLFQTLGMYEVRAYHVTDVGHRFSFGTYLATRLVTVALMVLGIIANALWVSPTASTALLVIMVACLRVFDALEDVFLAEFQRAGRLDLGGRAATVRTAVTVGVFCLALALTRDLAASALVALPVSAAVMLLAFLPPARGLFACQPQWRARAIVGVLVQCLPLFVASFLAMYLVNAPRYAIAAHLDLRAQGCFAIIYMPAVTINLLSLLVFRPLLTPMAVHWARGELAAFTGRIHRGLATTGVAFLVVAAVAWPLGPWILEAVLGQDVRPLRAELMVLVAGGALNAAAVILYYALTTMRRQRLVLLGYALAAAASWALCRLLVPRSGLMGASAAYAASMGVLAAAFALCLLPASGIARGRVGQRWPTRHGLSRGR
ncbi:lipopolysaccharide biosynthesis protein [Actinomyces capricornis]|uniref:Exopolysaccharide biosynthesis protein n=1 Tax=Actinomyces capricornis TaxID=2755559 RepID=A0ABM7UEI7_9ACTO|nr:lipopolysaccharide biosynthesis protein [Actinomyces capricornis]BDA63679.1 exopolysaccharide biosynthesis protein [Actinomyces capricornis]